MSVNLSLQDLPLEQRIQLVEDLWDSIASDQNAVSVTDAQRAELDRRLDAYAFDGNPGRPAEKAIAGIRKKL